MTIHQRIQEYILEAIPDALLEHPFKEIGRKADLYWKEKNLVFEVQFSPMHPIEARERMRDYSHLGIRVIWILHENMFNPLKPTPFQQFLRHFPHYYTNMDPILGGTIYEVKISGHKVERREVHFGLRT